MRHLNILAKLKMILIDLKKKNKQTNLKQVDVIQNRHKKGSLIFCFYILYKIRFGTLEDFGQTENDFI